jgi:5-methylcytosine-specific restriction endonuclease McrA
MPQRIPTHKPLRLRTAARRDESGRPNAAARGYCGKAHRRWRQAVLTRDGFACVDCGRIDQANHADHVVPIAQGGERYDMSNGACRCSACHARKTMRERGEVLQNATNRGRSAS